MRPATVRLGDREVRRMGFGAMRVTGEGVWGPPPDVARAHLVLRRAVELGVDLIDTADAYGPEVSERLIAEALHPYPPRLVVATKGGLTRPGRGEWRRDGRPVHLRAALDASLERLRLERIELYQLHARDRDVPYADSVRALAQMRDEGKVRHVGLCNVDVGMLDEALAIVPVVSVQNQYNLRERRSDPVLDACERRGIAFLPWFPLGTGELLRDQAVRAVAQAREATPAQVALAWLLQRSPVVLPIPGTGDPAHLAENMGAADLELTRGDVARLEAS